MAQSAASPSLPGAQFDNRQSRLDAAIALFRSEASASGYVVEEVRLRLPVPNVDVMPRVIIAQQRASPTTPPTCPSAKHPRPLSSYPSTTPSDHPAASRRALLCSNSTNNTSRGRHVKPIARLGTKSRNAPGTSAGFKRTVSGSVIFHPIPARSTSAKHEFRNSDTHTSHASQTMVPLSSVPYLPRKDSSSSVVRKAAQKEPEKGAFWKTVIGSERGEAILRAAESMHIMRHGVNGPKLRPAVLEEQDTAEMEVDSQTKLGLHNNDIAEGEEDVQETGDRRKAGEKQAENTLHINGHNIPESHVQLLLSSAVDPSARKKSSVRKKVEDSPDEKSSKAENKKVTARQETVNRKPGGTKAIPGSHGKQISSKGRRDSSDGHHSRSAAARPFRCHKCASSFDRDGHLRVHILAVHEKKRPFVCQICDASFGHSSSLLRHVRTVHQASPAVGPGRHNLPSRSGQKSNDSGTTKSEGLWYTLEDDNEKHFRCSACGQAFHRVALLNRHVANRHPLKSSSPEKRDDTRKSS